MYRELRLKKSQTNSKEKPILPSSQVLLDPLVESQTVLLREHNKEQNKTWLPPFRSNVCLQLGLLAGFKGGSPFQKNVKYLSMCAFACRESLWAVFDFPRSLWPQKADKQPILNLVMVLKVLLISNHEMNENNEDTVNRITGRHMSCRVCPTQLLLPHFHSGLWGNNNDKKSTTRGNGICVRYSYAAMKITGYTYSTALLPLPRRY